MAILIGALAATGVAAPATVRAQTANPQIDYPGFMKLTSELAEYRSSRLVSLDEFNRKAAKEGAIILDTRSVAAFQRAISRVP